MCLICDKDLWDKNQVVKHVEVDHSTEVINSGKKAEEFVKRIKVKGPEQKIEECELSLQQS